MRVLTGIDRAAVRELRARDEFFWLELIDPAEDAFAALDDLLGLHPVAAQNMREFGQRPKLDSYGDYAQLAFYGARSMQGDDADLIEVHLLISGSYVVTVHREQCDELDRLRQTLQDSSRTDTEQYIVYRVLDSLTDTFFPVLEELDEEIDALDERVIEAARREDLQRINELRRGLVDLRRVVSPQRDIFARSIDDLAELPGLERSSRDWFRDVYDHLIRISELVDASRDLLSASTDLYLATKADQRDEVMKQLTVIATIFLPLTVLTGFFGQNFGWLVGHIDSLSDFLVYGVGGLMASVAALVVYFRRRGWT